MRIVHDNGVAGLGRWKWVVVWLKSKEEPTQKGRADADASQAGIKKVVPIFSHNHHIEASFSYKEQPFLSTSMETAKHTIHEKGHATEVRMAELGSGNKFPAKRCGQ